MTTVIRRHQATFLVVLLVATVPMRGPLAQLASNPALQSWATVFVAIVVQALPFLVGGVLLAAAISTLLSEKLIQRVVPRNPVLAVPAAGLAGMALPGCECASVPVGGGLVRRGIAPAAALTFILASPAVNPVVLVTTAVAFPGDTAMVLARFLASMTVAVGIGWIWLARGGTVPLRSAHHHGSGSWRDFLTNAQHDLLHTGGFLVLGALVAASVHTFLPTEWLDRLAANLLLSVLVLGAFAFIVAICSEADAFVAASFATFSPVAQLAFMVVGPAVDVKLAALHAGQSGTAFAVRFVPLTFVVALASALGIGWWLL